MNHRDVPVEPIKSWLYIYVVEPTGELLCRRESGGILAGIAERHGEAPVADLSFERFRATWHNELDACAGWSRSAVDLELTENTTFAPVSRTWDEVRQQNARAHRNKSCIGRFAGAQIRCGSAHY